MLKQLSVESARALSKKYRYSEDFEFRKRPANESTSSKIQRILFTNGLQVSKDITPKLYECLVIATENLHLPVESVCAVVSSSSELQAQCFYGDDARCCINLSSSLVNLLNPDEVVFVMGHEIGHFILRHNQEIDRNESLENFIHQRAKEISVDRAGLVACQSLEASLRATIKVLSGLPDQYIRFDMSNFLNQLRAADQENASLSETYVSHPSLILRARALLWFSMNDEIKIGEKAGSLSLSKIDALIKKDLDKYLDGPARKKIEDTEKDLKFWMASLEITEKGILTKEDQTRLITEFGETSVKKLISMLDGIDVNEVRELLKSKVNQSISELAILTPDSIDKRFYDLKDKVSKSFN
jgi:hypothetical protein